MCGIVKNDGKTKWFPSTDEAWQRCFRDWMMMMMMMMMMKEFIKLYYSLTDVKCLHCCLLKLLGMICGMIYHER